MRRVRGTRHFMFFLSRTDGWFRVYGYGLAYRRGPLTFSERNGYERCWRIGPWRLTVLRP